MSAPPRADGRPDPHRAGSSLLLSLECQLVSLYAERQALETALGVSDADDVVGLVADLRTRAADTARADALAEELAGVRAELEAVRASLIAAQAALEAAEAAGAAAADEARAARESLSRRDVEAATADAQWTAALAAAEDRAAGVAAERDALAVEAATWREQHAALQAAYDEVVARGDAARVEEITAQLAASTARELATLERLGEERHHTASLTAALAEARERLGELEAARAGLQTELARSQQRSQALRDEVAALGVIQEKTADALAAARREAAGLYGALDEATTERDALGARLGEARDDAGRLRVALEHAASDRDAAHRRIQDLERRLATVEATNPYALFAPVLDRTTPAEGRLVDRLAEVLAVVVEPVAGGDEGRLGSHGPGGAEQRVTAMVRLVEGVSELLKERT